MKELLEVIRRIDSLALHTPLEDFLEGVAECIRENFSCRACSIEVGANSVLESGSHGGDGSLVIPLASGGSALGRINVVSDRKMGRDERTALEAVATHLSAVLTLRHHSERYRTLFDYIPHPVVSVSSDGRVTDTNPTFDMRIQCSGGCVGRRIWKLIHPGDAEGVRRAITAARGGERAVVEARLMTGDGDFIPTELTVIPVSNEVLCVFTDIGDRKRLEEAEKRRMARFYFEEGCVYLAREHALCSSAEAFADLLNIGYSGFVISSRNGDALRGVVDADHISVTLPAEPGLIEERLRGLPKRSAVLLDGLEQLVHLHGIGEVLCFLRNLSEIAAERSLVVLISADPRLLSDRELGIIEKTLPELEPLDGEFVDESIYDILEIIYSRNAYGRMPKYNDICREAGLSKPTVRKKIKFLLSRNYVTEVRRGRCKLLHITEKGIGLIRRHRRTLPRVAEQIEGFGPGSS
ncbi:MAG: PAS domain S-box protein [Euryarchaeota archaeon]|nr:PAS domain S-box protein [Euryarchaeota archaeon]